MLEEGDWVRHCIFKLQGGKIDLFIFVVFCGRRKFNKKVKNISLLPFIPLFIQVFSSNKKLKICLLYFSLK